MNGKIYVYFNRKNMKKKELKNIMLDKPYIQ